MMPQYHEIRLPDRRQLVALAFLTLGASLASGSDPELPAAKPVPDLQVIPLPHNEVSFQHLGRELTRYLYSPAQERPFWYPLNGPADRPLTRMGHPRDPFGHSHHNSVWISHNDVGGVTFWPDRLPDAEAQKKLGRIVHQWINQFEDGTLSATMLTTNAWQTLDGKLVMQERRRMMVEVLSSGDWLMHIDLELEPPPAGSVTLGATPFGMIGVRMAKTIGVADGGGRILNSNGQINEKAAFRQLARGWTSAARSPTRSGAASHSWTIPPTQTTPAHFMYATTAGWVSA